MNTVELVFVPAPGMGHLPPALEMACRLAARETYISIHVLVMRLPSDTRIDLYAQSVASTLQPRVKISYLPRHDHVVGNNAFESVMKSIESYKPDVANAVGDLKRVSAFVVDIFCTAMMDVATSIGVPSYVFSPLSASYLGILCHMAELRDRHRVDVTKYGDFDAKLDFPAFLKQLPATAVPQAFVTKETTDRALEPARKYRDAKGLLINTFWELEQSPLKYLSDLKLPPVYPVGPIVRLNGAAASTISSTSSNTELLEWLDNQPRLSVVFVCFGSMGSFGDDQVKEIAAALESAGYRFLWSLKPLPHKASFIIRDDYATFEGILPEGFLGRTAEVGRVMGWVPQAEILSHPSVGGFVSHCGWNSILESIWSGVPIAAWPLFAEQQLNAFQMVAELGLATEIKLDYWADFEVGGRQVVIRADEIEKAIREVMKEDSEQRKKVKEMSEIGKEALKEGTGSSYLSLGRFIQDILQ